MATGDRTLQILGSEQDGTNVVLLDKLTNLCDAQLPGLGVQA